MDNARILLQFLMRRWPWVLGFALCTLLIWLFLIGWRISPTAGITRSGALVFEQLPPRSAVYIDNVRRHTDRLSTRTNLKDGTHSVIIDAPGYQPWNEIVTITSNVDTVGKPIFVPSIPVRRPLDENELKLARLGIGVPLPSMERPMELEGACVSIYLSFNRVVAQPGVDCEPPEFLCTADGSCDPLVVFPAEETIRSVIPMPGRTDALVIAAGSEVYVVEIDPHTPQFFAPLYSGKSPRAMRWIDSAVVVMDEGSFYHIAI